MRVGAINLLAWLPAAVTCVVPGAVVYPAHEDAVALVIIVAVPLALIAHGICTARTYIAVTRLPAAISSRIPGTVVFAADKVALTFVVCIAVPFSLVAHSI